MKRISSHLPDRSPVFQLEPAPNRHWKPLLKACALALSLFLLAVAPPAVAETPGAPPPEAKEAMRIGLEAAKEKDWKAAIKHFTEALEFDITASPVLFNLAYAHDRMGLDEFQAIYFYRAYLATAPNAKNAGSVGNRIAELETRIKAKVMKFFALSEQIASKLPNSDRGRESDDEIIAIMHAAIGDFEEALSRAAGLESLSDDAFVGIAKFQAEYGDFTDARKTTGKLKDPNNKAIFFAHLAEIQAEAGDIDGALATAASISGLHRDNLQPTAYLDIAEQLIAVGDYSRAKTTLALAKQTIKPDHHQWTTLSRLLAKTGDFEEAWKTAAIAKSRKQDGGRYGGFWYLAKLLAISGNFARARQAIFEAPAGDRDPDLEKMVDALEQARKDLQEVTNDQERKAAQKEIRKYLWFRPDDVEGPRLPLLKREVLQWIWPRGFGPSRLSSIEHTIRYIERENIQESAPYMISNDVNLIMTELMQQRRLAAYWQARRQRAERPNAASK